MGVNRKYFTYKPFQRCELFAILGLIPNHFYGYHMTITIIIFFSNFLNFCICLILLIILVFIQIPQLNFALLPWMQIVSILSFCIWATIVFFVWFIHAIYRLYSKVIIYSSNSTSIPKLTILIKVVCKIFLITWRKINLCTVFYNIINIT